MPHEIDLTVTVKVNGRPIWSKTRRSKLEIAGQLPDDEYDRVTGVAERELERLLKIKRNPPAPESEKKDGDRKSIKSGG